MEHLVISELGKTVNPLTGNTHILIRISAKPPDQIEVRIGDSYVVTSSITFKLIQRGKDNQSIVGNQIGGP